MTQDTGLTSADGCSANAETGGSSGSRGPTAIVPVVDLAESHREDGRLLRMFVGREQHLKAQARELATRNWLIPASFYDEWLEEFVRCYAPSHEMVDDLELEARTTQLRLALRTVLKTPEKASVEALEACLRDCDGDVYKLRDTLLAAVKNLMNPRRLLGRGGGKALTEEAIMALKMQRQVRLRDVVMACLNEIHTSGVGGEVLRIAMSSVRNMIERFETKEDDICTAMKGDQWQKLKQLMGTIEGEALPALEDKGAEGDARALREGKGTKTLIDVALTELGGQGTTQEIINWVEAHPDLTAEYSRIRINQNKRCSKRSKDPEKAVPVWHSTVRSVLSCHFEGGRMKGRGYIWYRKGEKPPDALADAPALLDAPQESGNESSQLALVGASERKKKAVPKRHNKEVSSDGAVSEPKRRRKSEAVATDGDDAKPKKAKKAKAAPPCQNELSPRLLLAVDDAMKAASS